jgi:protein involved in polysaccharide export with SLBB domain
MRKSAIFLTAGSLAVGLSVSMFAGSTTNNVEPPYIYVAGPVLHPGQYGWTNGMTVVDGIKMAGGFTGGAGGIMVQHVDGEHEHFNRYGTNKPPLLKAGDKVVVFRR